METKQLTNLIDKVSRWCSIRSGDGAQHLVNLKSADGVLHAYCHGVFGGAVDCAPYDGPDIYCAVDSGKLSKSLKFLQDDHCDLEEGGNFLKVSCGKTKLKLDKVDYQLIQGVVTTNNEVIVSRKDFISGAGNIMFAWDPKDTKHAEAQRLTAVDGELQFAGENKSIYACSWIPCQGSMDALVPYEALRPLLYSLKNCSDNEVFIFSEESTVTVRCGTFASWIPGVSGKMPRDKSAFMNLLASLMDSEWLVDKKDILDFVYMAGIFSTETATGIYLTPQDDGLHLEFDRRSFDTGVQDMASGGMCSTVIPGKTGGGRMRMDANKLGKLLSQAGEEGFAIKSLNGGLAVQSEGFAAALAKLYEPGTKV